VRNAFGEATRDHLLGSLQQAGSDPEVHCVVITGVGDSFAAGGDIKSMAALQEHNDTEVVASRIRVAGAIVQLIQSMPKPVIAAINGAAAGGAMNLALACDLRYAADTAVFAQSFVRIGLVPDWGGHYLLTRIVGTGRALELMMLGERIDAATALRLGIVNAVYPAAAFREQVHTRARALAQGPCAAIAAIKRGVYLGARAPLAEILAFEEAAQAELFLSDDAREGMRAFIEKRAPEFGK
jgi:2-(1,2-epoxy-1,2-dihydrophenyl)acetyl-CoA isomerase